MKKILDNRELYERLNKFEFLVQLTRYIYRMQGTELRRLDFPEAARALNVDRKDIARGCLQLAERNVITIVENELKINDEIEKEVG